MLPFNFSFLVFSKSKEEKAGTEAKAAEPATKFLIAVLRLVTDKN